MENEIKILENKIYQNSKTPLAAKLAKLYLINGEIDKAQNLCKTIIAYYPDYISPYIILSECFISLSQFNNAKITVTKISELFSNPECCDFISKIIEHYQNNPPDFFNDPNYSSSMIVSELEDTSYSNFNEIIEKHKTRINYIKNSLKTENIVSDSRPTLDMSFIADDFLTIDDFEVPRQESKSLKILAIDEHGNITDESISPDIISKDEIVSEIISEKFDESDNIEVTKDEVAFDLEISNIQNEIIIDKNIVDELSLSTEQEIVEPLETVKPPVERFDLKEELDILNPFDENVPTKLDTDELKLNEEENTQNHIPENFVNKTLAGIYEGQGKFEEAIEVYNQLFLNEIISPEEYQDKMVELKAKLLEGATEGDFLKV